MKKIKYINVTFLIVFLLILSGGVIKPFLRPLSVNVIENRTANQIPKLSFSAILDKTFQEQYETAMADQIPFAPYMKLTEKSIELLAKLSFFKLDVYGTHKLDKLLFYEDGYLMAIPLEFTDKRRKGLNAKAENLNQVIKKLNNVEFYLYYIEKDEDINFKNGKRSNFYEYLIKKIDNKINTRKFAVDTLIDYKELFYKTDHHWNNKGSHRAYADIVEWMNLGTPLRTGIEVCADTGYTGSRDVLTGGNWLFKEPFCVFPYEMSAHNVTINRGNAVLTQNSQIPDSHNVGYGKYYGEDVGFIHYDFFQESKENLLIIGNSYDNAINELLASHFNHTYNVDLRHYEADMNEPFDIYAFVKKYNIDKILMIGNYSVYMNNEFDLKGGN